jgi:competence protein ComEA
MEAEFIAEKLTPILRKFWIPLSFGVVGLILLGYGLIGLAARTPENEIIVEKAEGENTMPVEEKIIVDIAGAVISPGAYEMPASSRVKDLIVKAGGISDTADRNWFAKNVNLASKLSDGGKLYIPHEGEGGSSTTQVLGQTSAGGLININSSSEKELDSLPGVGAVTASKIINGRPYQAIEELVSKKIVSNKVFENIKSKISTF